jgi:hypothetical protein
MATAKYKSIKFGPGSYANKNGESEWFIEQRAPYSGIPGTVIWSVSTTYFTGDAVTYKGISYNAISGNIGQQPDITPFVWSQVDGKDGDVWIQVPVAGFPLGGSDVEMYMKANNAWQGIKGTPTYVSLLENPLPNAPVVAFEIPAGAFRYAKIEYTVSRNNNIARQRKGTFEILNDGSNLNYSNEFVELGNDVNTYFTLNCSAGKVRVLYTNDTEGTTVDIKYTVKGWA